MVGLVATFGSGAMTNSVQCFEEADCYLITGSDTVGQHPLIASRIIKSITDRGAKLLIFDPHHIDMTKYATIHARQQPGTDVAWLNGLMNVIIKEGLEDKKYVEERTLYFEELKKTVEKYTPEYVESITGIKADTIIKAARIYATTKKAMIIYAMGITQHITGVDNVKSCANLAMLTGHVGLPSTGVNPLRGQNNVQGACDMGCLVNVFSGYQKVADENARKKFEKAWNVENLSSTPGLTVTEIIDALGTGKVKGLYIMGENPVISDPNSNHVKECLSKAEFLIVQDNFLTATAEYADVVLPGASFAEKNGTFTNTERRCQLIRKAIEPPGEAKSDWEILSMVAKACGYEGMNYNSASEIMDEIASVTHIYGGMYYDRLVPAGLQWPCTDRDHPGTKYLHKGKFSKGKGTFVPCTYIPPAESVDDEYNFILTTGRIYWHFHTGTMTRRTSVLDREVPEAYVEINPNDAKKLGVRTGTMVKVTSRRGNIELKVVVAERMKEGIVYIPFHFKEASANVLTSSNLDPTAKIPEYKVSAVKVEVI